MKLAIHHGENGFSERWIEYCKKNDIKYILVNCYDSDIINQLRMCDALLWNWFNGDYKALKFARQLIYSLEIMGKKVFPDSKTCWHYEDKIGQKYLLEAICAPFIPTHIFYDKKIALDWIDTETFPKVFKLSTGSGSTNVKLAHDSEDAKRLVHKSFGSGFPQMNRLANSKDKFDAWKRNKNKATLIAAIRSVVRIFIPTTLENMQGREKGYAYFQDFIPNNDYDIRVITIGNKAFAIKRMCRPGDFRASGGGQFIYEKEQLDERCIKISLETSKKLNAQSVAYDFVFDKDNNPLMIEISYTFWMAAFDECQGYWDENLNWHEGKFNPQYWMIENLIASL